MRTNKTQETHELLKTLVQSLVEAPDDVVIRQIDADGYLILEIGVAPTERAVIVGKQGKMLDALRTIAGRWYFKQGGGKRLRLEIKE